MDISKNQWRSTGGMNLYTAKILSWIYSSYWFLLMYLDIRTWGAKQNCSMDMGKWDNMCASHAVCHVDNQVCWNLTIHMVGCIHNKHLSKYSKWYLVWWGAINPFFLFYGQVNIVKCITRLVCLKIQVYHPFLYFLGIDFQLLRGCLCSSSAYSLKQAKLALAWNWSQDTWLLPTPDGLWPRLN